MTDAPQMQSLQPKSPNEGLLSNALRDFEFRLSSRTRVPQAKLGEFFHWSDERIRHEAQCVSRVLKRFAEAVVESMEHPESADSFLHELDLKSISRDHDWRAIFSTIRSQASGYEGFKRAVLIKYLQYLSFRKRLLEYVREGRAGLEDTDERASVCVDAESLDAVGQAPGADGAERAGEFLRLPLGEAVEVDLPMGRKVNLMLAGHAFRLSGAIPPSLVDQNGVMYFLKEGRNMVGRHPESDVVIDPDFGDVSRAHVIIEWDGTSVLTVLDLSSRGTFLHEGALRKVESVLDAEDD